MDPLNPKIIDINLKSIKYFVIIILLYISGCDFRMPQDWETPKWILPVTIPMLDEIIEVADLIQSDSSSIQLIGSDYSVTQDSLVMIPKEGEGSISIDESYFTVPSVDIIEPNENHKDDPPIYIKVPEINTGTIIPEIIINIPISDVIPPELDGYDCIPIDALNGSESIDNLTEIKRYEIEQ